MARTMRIGVRTPVELLEAARRGYLEHARGNEVLPQTANETTVVRYALALLAGLDVNRWARPMPPGPAPKNRAARP